MSPRGDAGTPRAGAAATADGGRLDAPGAAVAAWLLSSAFEARLFEYFPCSDAPRDGGDGGAASGSSGAPSPGTPGSPVTPHRAPPHPAPALTPTATLAAPPTPVTAADLEAEAATEARCEDAFAGVAHFEATHRLSLETMGAAYLTHRPTLVAVTLAAAATLGLVDEVAHDAVLLADRAASAGVRLGEGGEEEEVADETTPPSTTTPVPGAPALAAACLAIAAAAADRQGNGPPMADAEDAAGAPRGAGDRAAWAVTAALSGDTSAISALRVLKLCLERLGASFLDGRAVTGLAGGSLALATRALHDPHSLNCRPSAIAAAALVADRRARGVLPAWPSMLSKMTGATDLNSPELAAALRCVARASDGEGVPAAGEPSTRKPTTPPVAGPPATPPRAAPVVVTAPLTPMTPQ